MRIERAKAKMGSRAVLAGVVAGLTLAAGTLLATGGAPPKRATSSVSKSEALASATADRISPREAIADRDSLDLQLD